MGAAVNPDPKREDEQTSYRAPTVIGIGTAGGECEGTESSPATTPARWQLAWLASQEVPSAPDLPRAT
jgi:hypothetical protein